MCRVNTALAALLREHDGVVTRPVALRAVPEHVLIHAMRAGHVRSPYPGVILAASLAGNRLVRFRAALLRAGPGAALSHTTALEVWDLPAPPSRAVHVMTGPARRLRVTGIVAHRRGGFVAEPPAVVIRRDLPVTALEQSLVDSWPLASDDTQRAPVLEAVARRLTTADRMLAAVDVHGARLVSRAALRDLLGKIAAGCRSELELWGYDNVFAGPGLPHLERQVPVKVGGSTMYLDLFHRATATNFELDGAKWHGGFSQRERDLRRDATLATLGIQVVRFSHDRLVLEPDAARREALAILTRRAAIIGR